MNSHLAAKLREVAELIERDHQGECISFRSQNLSLKGIEPYVIEREDGSPHDISVRGERLSYDSTTIRARWIVKGGRGKGIFQTPDKKFFRVSGEKGDSWFASSMCFKEIPESKVVVQAQESLQKG